LREVCAEEHGGLLARKVRRAFCLRVGEELLLHG
jgi:hypothetical protein